MFSFQESDLTSISTPGGTRIPYPKAGGVELKLPSIADDGDDDVAVPPESGGGLSSVGIITLSKGPATIQRTKQVAKPRPPPKSQSKGKKKQAASATATSATVDYMTSSKVFEGRTKRVAKPRSKAKKRQMFTAVAVTNNGKIDHAHIHEKKSILADDEMQMQQLSCPVGGEVMNNELNNQSESRGDVTEGISMLELDGTVECISMEVDADSEDMGECPPDAISEKNEVENQPPEQAMADDTTNKASPKEDECKADGLERELLTPAAASTKLADVPSTAVKSPASKATPDATASKAPLAKSPITPKANVPSQSQPTTLASACLTLSRDSIMSNVHNRARKRRQLKDDEDSDDDSDSNEGDSDKANTTNKSADCGKGKASKGEQALNVTDEQLNDLNVSTSSDEDLFSDGSPCKQVSNGVKLLATTQTSRDDGADLDYSSLFSDSDDDEAEAPALASNQANATNQPDDCDRDESLLSSSGSDVEDIITKPTGRTESNDSKPPGDIVVSTGNAAESRAGNDSDDSSLFGDDNNNKDDKKQPAAEFPQPSKGSSSTQQEPSSLKSRPQYQTFERPVYNPAQESDYDESSGEGSLFSLNDGKKPKAACTSSNQKADNTKLVGFVMPKKSPTSLSSKAQLEILKARSRVGMGSSSEKKAVRFVEEVKLKCVGKAARALTSSSHQQQRVLDVGAFAAPSQPEPPKRTNYKEKTWNKHFMMLKSYITKHRHCDVADGHTLAPWIKQQRSVSRRILKKSSCPNANLSDGDFQKLVHTFRLHQIGIDWEFATKRKVKDSLKAKIMMLNEEQRELLAKYEDKRPTKLVASKRGIQIPRSSDNLSGEDEYHFGSAKQPKERISKPVCEDVVKRSKKRPKKSSTSSSEKRQKKLQREESATRSEIVNEEFIDEKPQRLSWNSGKNGGAVVKPKNWIKLFKLVRKSRRKAQNTSQSKNKGWFDLEDLRHASSLPVKSKSSTAAPKKKSNDMPTTAKVTSLLPEMPSTLPKPAGAPDQATDMATLIKQRLRKKIKESPGNVDPLSSAYNTKFTTNAKESGKRKHSSKKSKGKDEEPTAPAKKVKRSTIPMASPKESKYPVEAVEGFPDGWLLRRVPRITASNIADVYFYSPKMGIRFRSKREVSSRLRLLK